MVIIMRLTTVLLFSFVTIPTVVTSLSIQPTTTKSLVSTTTSTTSSSISTNDPTTTAATSRSEFFQQVGTVAAAAATAAVATTTTGLVVAVPQPAYARGRATLEQAYDRYTPRILSGGDFYKTKLKSLISKEDWEGIKLALQEPPKKSKSDRSKQDGGVSERAAQAGQFSDARVITAMDLFAATFSDNSVSSKTKAMKKEVVELRSVVEQMKSIARQATGEEAAGSGGLFGMGKKQPSKSELSNKMKELYIVGGTSWNRYVFAANDGLPVALKKLPYL